MLVKIFDETTNKNNIVNIHCLTIKKCLITIYSDVVNLNFRASNETLKVFT